MRRLRPQLRRVAVLQGQATEEVSEVQEVEAAPFVRHRSGRALQGFGLLPDRLPQRLVQVGGQGGGRFVFNEGRYNRQRYRQRQDRIGKCRQTGEDGEIRGKEGKVLGLRFP